MGLSVCVSLFSSCSKDDEGGGDSSSNPLVGTWRAEVEEKGEVQYCDLTFNADFTFLSKEYNKDDNKLHDASSGTYKLLDASTLQITNSNGEVYLRRFKITDGIKFEFLDYDHGIIYYKVK